MSDTDTETAVMPLASVDLHAYVRRLADMCDLRDWHIEVAVGDVDDETLATCQPTLGQKHATISFADSWRTWSAFQLRSTVAHELVHCHFAALDSLVSEMLRSGLGKASTAIADIAYTHQNEYLVDGLSLLIAKTLPLPESAAS